MKVLVINAGSSSLKFQLIDMEAGEVLAKGNCERIGVSGEIKHTAKGETYKKEIDMPTHIEAFNALIAALTTGDLKVIDDMSEITAVGH